MNLPPELRLQILGYCVKQPKPIDRTTFRIYNSTVAATMLVCRTLRSEAEEVFYRQNIFKYRFDDDIRGSTLLCKKLKTLNFPDTNDAILYNYSLKALSDQYSALSTPYSFPRRVRPMIQHLDLVFGIHIVDHVNSKNWLSPLPHLDLDGFSRLKSANLSFVLYPDKKMWTRGQILEAKKAVLEFFSAFRLQAARAKPLPGFERHRVMIEIDWEELCY